MKTDMKKGTEVKFLDYRIVSCTNDDGIVLLKDEPYDHLGNFSKLDEAKQSATIHFMLERPKDFAQCIHNRVMHGPKSGTQHEWYKLKDVLQREGIEMPKELAKPYDAMNAMIGYNGRPISWIKNKELLCDHVYEASNDFKCKHCGKSMD